MSGANGGTGALRRLLRTAMWIAAVLAVLLVVAGLALAWLTATTAGSRWSLKRSASFAGIDLRFADLEGSIYRNLVIGDLYAGLDGMTIEADRLALRTDMSSLLGRRLVVEDLAVENLRVTVQPDTAAGPAEEPSARPPQISLPMDVEVRQARVDGAVWRGPGGDSLALGAVRLEGTMEGSDIHLEHLDVESSTLDVVASGDLQTSGDWPLVLALEWTARPDSARRITGSGGVGGSMARLELDQQLYVPHPVAVDAELRDVFGRLTFEARARTRGMPLGTWWEAAAGAEATAEAFVSGAPDSLTATADVSISGLEGHAYDLELRAAHANDAVRLERLSVTGASGAVDVTASGYVRGLGSDPRAEATIRWTQLAWPPGAPDFESTNGTLRVDGSPGAWSAVLDGDVTTRWTGTGHWRARAHGDTASARIERLAGDLLGGGVSAQGRVAWEPALVWRGRIEARGMDPATRWPAWAGSLVAGLEASGRLRSGGIEGRVQIERLEGRLRGREIAASGDVRLTPDAVAVDGLEVDWGEARLRADGRAGNTLDFDASLHAPELSLWWPGARGSLAVTAQIQGPRERPRVIAEATGDSLGYRGWSARHLRLDANADLAGTEQSRVQLTVADLENPQPFARRIELDATGTLDGHQVEGRLIRGGDSLSVTAQGSWEDERWQGRIARLDLDSPEMGDWRITRPARLTLGAAGEVEVDTLDWGSGDAALAASVGGDAERGYEVRASLQRMTLERLGAWMPEEMDVRGPLRAQLYAHIVPEAAPEVALRVTAGPGTVTYRTQGGRQTSAFDTARVVWNSGETGARGTLEVSAPGLLVADGRVELPGFGHGTTAGGQPVDGRLSVEVPQLSAFSGMWQDLEQPRGALHMDLRLDGTVESPRFLGEAVLEGGGARLPAAGIELTDATMRIEADGSDSLTVRASARSGPGTMTLEGRIAATRLDSLRANLSLEGRRVRVLDLENIQLIASPDLHIGVDDNEVRVSGQVRIPRGRLSDGGASEREAVALSPDVVIEDREVETDAPLELHATVRVVLGDSVSIDAFGLKTDLKGSILLTERPAQPPIASGELTIEGGTYTAYGQQLTIERGRLLFAGGPVTNPGLDIRAVRLARDGTVAGLEVRGTALDPQVSIFSEPQMPEEQALAYILLGRPLDEAGADDGPLLERAARSAGLRGGNLLAGKIASELGLDEASIETGDTGTFEEASLLLGTYLSPRVYLGYAVGLFKPANSFLIRYRISTRWAIEAEAADENSAEILFTTES